MIDIPGYDEWKLSNREDEEDNRQRILEREEALRDRADYLHDRDKDERAERQIRFVDECDE